MVMEVGKGNGSCEIISTRTVMKKIAKDRKVIPDPIVDRKFQE